MSFNKWWPCPRKHTKRVRYLLPHAKELKAKLQGARPFRYFTLCALSMIDVFMLTKEGVLDYDEPRRAIDTVVFCEYDRQDVPVMRELIGRENSGFSGKLEDIVLFEDDTFSAQFPDILAIENHLTRKGESLHEDELDVLRKKVDHYELRDRFPFDFINLDFCDPYYPSPPDIMKINRAVERILEWQRRPQEVDSPSKMFKVDEFMMAITCRHDDTLPTEARNRLINLIRTNCQDSLNYKEQLAASRPEQIERWADTSKLDFFLAGWPKEIARVARDKLWDMQIIEYVHYPRDSASDHPYEMVCLVCLFKRTEFSTTYLDVAMKALDKDQRREIGQVNLEEQTGRDILADLTSIVELRNLHAANANRDTLPNPTDAIREFEEKGVRY